MKRIVSEEVKNTLRNNGLIHSKPVEQLNICTGEIMATYPSINQAARMTKANKRGISKCCNNTAEYSAHCLWRFKLKTKENGDGSTTRK